MKRKPKPLKFKFPVPVLPDKPLPEELIIAPQPIEPEKVELLPTPHGPIRCIATRIHGWSGDYLVLAAKDGHELPEVSEYGTEVDVQFTPPPPA
jgi:hypothetical protein